MILIVGLGNPGEKYIKTWHNIGFEVVQDFAQKNNFSDFKLDKFLKTYVTRGEMHGKGILIAKPQTFMNLSGKAVKEIYGKNIFDELIIVHDDIDLPLGTIRISKNRGSAGHNGVKSIMEELKTEEFIRVRIGVNPIGKKINNPESFVLKIPAQEHKKTLKQEMEKAVTAIERILEKGIEKTMNEFN